MSQWVQSDANLRQLAERITALSTTEIERIGSAYFLGQIAALQHNAIARTALSILMELLQHPWNVVARCAMYGVTNAGARATDSLCMLLKDITTQLTRLDPVEQTQSMIDGGELSKLLDLIALVAHALGESTQYPTERVVKALSRAFETALTHLEAHIQRLVDTAAVQTPVRTGINVNLEDGRGPDRTLSLAVRAASAVMDALGLVAERVVAPCDCPVGVVGETGSIPHEIQSLLVAQICDVVLPVSLRPDPSLQIPGNMLSHDNSRFWLAEATAYCVLRLVSSGAAHVQTASLQVVRPGCPAHHSDQRYAPALCLAAIGRLRQLISIPNAVPTAVAELLPRLEEAEKGWEAMAADASVDNPEPWLSKGVHGVEWQ